MQNRIIMVRTFSALLYIRSESCIHLRNNHHLYNSTTFAIFMTSIRTSFMIHGYCKKRKIDVKK